MNGVTLLRTSSRFRLRFFVRFRWRDNTGIHFGDGSTRDINSKGLFVLTETLPRVNSVIRCWFYLPTREQLHFELGYKVTTVARVLRVTTEVMSSEDTGFAVSARVIALTDCEDFGKSEAFFN